ncbi:hypothetical protein [Bradyrhizobium sp. UFLA03-84]|uniref:hypothetical protein n=1 Tax=Bradyrhizobium sp. UFLA03-84 TaxID=418599 RepID=UPI0032DF666E
MQIARNERAAERFIQAEVISVLMTKERPKAIRTVRGWVINVLQEVGAIHECEEHGAKDRGDPHARDRAVDLARQQPPEGVPADEATAALRNVLESLVEGLLIPEYCPMSSPTSSLGSLGCSFSRSAASRWLNCELDTPSFSVPTWR